MTIFHPCKARYQFKLNTSLTCFAVVLTFQLLRFSVPCAKLSDKTGSHITPSTTTGLCDMFVTDLDLDPEAIIDKSSVLHWFYPGCLFSSKMSRITSLIPL